MQSLLYLLNQKIFAISAKVIIFIAKGMACQLESVNGLSFGILFFDVGNHKKIHVTVAMWGHSSNITGSSCSTIPR